VRLAAQHGPMGVVEVELRHDMGEVEIRLPIGVKRANVSTQLVSKRCA
jgi:hypothetical protein